eukprot:TRINITY_DN26959_c0_g1_i1.p1 TRINITY_DN26959_c0_g1~~TRINITY_DN26959_c0_g1_i1.p1  ORF type:complete len:251 (+),score=49.51 TRINITY_DN26959_c0_g1_i1:78-755(+)
MASEQARIRTFCAFPHSKVAGGAAALAAAGFYHNPVPGNSDRCTCFCCGVSLLRWESDDDPWREHKRHSPSCPFVASRPTGGRATAVADTKAPSVELLVSALLSRGAPPQRQQCQPASSRTASGEFVRSALLGRVGGGGEWTCDDVSMAAAADDSDSSECAAAAPRTPSPVGAVVAHPPHAAEHLPPAPPPPPAQPVRQPPHRTTRPARAIPRDAAGRAAGAAAV